MEIKLTYTHGKTINFDIFYELTASNSSNVDPIVRKFLFGIVRLTKNAGIDKYGCSGYGIGFDRRGSFSFTGREFGISVILFAVNMRSSFHVDNKKRTF